MGNRVNERLLGKHETLKCSAPASRCAIALHTGLAAAVARVSRRRLLVGRVALVPGRSRCEKTEYTGMRPLE
jgi:hypothetical protein